MNLTRLGMAAFTALLSINQPPNSPFALLTAITVALFIATAGEKK